MNEKPHKLDVGFGEALARLARVPKPAVVNGGKIIKHKQPGQRKASPSTTAPNTGAD